MLSKNAEEKMNIEATLQGDIHAVVIIRSMYPSKSRTEISREFQQLYSIGFKDGYQVAQDEAKAEIERLMRTSYIKGAKDLLSYLNRNTHFDSVPIFRDSAYGFFIEALQKDDEVENDNN